MKQIKIEIEQRPNYYRNQLLLEDDFLAEQKYHVDARRHHSRHLHGWGVVQGLTVSRDSDTSLTINPGAAIDASGYEIFLETAQHVSLTEFEPNELLNVSLSCSEDSAGVTQKRRGFYAVITVSKITEGSAGLIIARVQLDGQGKLDEKAIDYAHTRYARIVAPGSITPTELHENLRKGWLRLPFRPVPLVNAPEEKDIATIPRMNAPREKGVMPPEFRVGPTEVLTPDPDEAGENDRGAAGTMAIPIPPSVTHATRLRIAGSKNNGGILLKLIRGGWDWSKKEHRHDVIVEKTITDAPYMETFDIDPTALDPEYHTLSLWLWGVRRTSISLVAIEFVY